MRKFTFWIPDFLPRLINGAGAGPNEGGCVMQVCDFLWSGKWTDSPSCVHPILRSFAIQTNDGATETERQKLWPLIPRLLGSYSEESVRSEPMKRLARYMLATSSYDSEYKDDIEMLRTLDAQIDENVYTARHVMEELPMTYTVETLTALLDEFDRINGRNKKSDFTPIARNRWDALEEVWPAEMETADAREAAVA